jgi:hypothetical protein
MGAALMKFEVKVGVSFEVDEPEARAKQRTRSRSPKGMGSVIVIVIISGLLLGTAIYGYVTGDFSFMERMWDGIRSHIPEVVKSHAG